MSTLTTTRVGTLPRVNLLPPEIEQARRFRHVQVGARRRRPGPRSLSSAALFLVASGQVGTAQDDLDASQRPDHQAGGPAAEYSQVPSSTPRSRLPAAQLELAMGKEIRWSFYLNDLSLKTPAQRLAHSMTVQSNDTADAVAAPRRLPAGGDLPRARCGVGLLRGLRPSSTTTSRAWLDALAKQKGYAQPYFTDSTERSSSGRPRSSGSRAR